jgi:hypothetical protein
MPRLGIILAPPEIQHRGLSMKPAMKWTFFICAAVACLLETDYVAVAVSGA